MATPNHKGTPPLFSFTHAALSPGRCTRPTRVIKIKFGRQTTCYPSKHDLDNVVLFTMDPLSVAASVMGIVGVVSGLSRGFYKCAKILLHAKEEVRAVAGELVVFSSMLRSLNQILNGVPKRLLQKLEMEEIYRHFQRTMDRVVMTLRGLLHDFKKLSRKSPQRLLALQRIRWYFKKPHVLVQRSVLEAVKLDLWIWISILHLGIAGDEISRNPGREPELRSIM